MISLFISFAVLIVGYIVYGRVTESGVLTEGHEGGCVLFEKRETVEKLLADPDTRT